MLFFLVIKLLFHFFLMVLSGWCLYQMVKMHRESSVFRDVEEGRNDQSRLIHARRKFRNEHGETETNGLPSLRDIVGDPPVFPVK